MAQKEKETTGPIIGSGNGDDSDGDVVPGSISSFKSKLPPIVDREEERRVLSAAERFDEGPVVKGLKTATWFSICALVAWEVYINSPLFNTPASPPIT